MASVTIKLEPETHKDDHKMCRLCLSEDLLHDIFTEEGLNQCILDLLSIAVSVDDRMSQAVCAMCRLRLTEFHQYRIRCHEVQDVLKSLIANDVVEKSTVQMDEENAPQHENSALAKEVGQGKQRTTQCDVCDAVFKTKNQLASHRKKHQKQKHECEICGRIFKFRKCFDKHVESHQDEYEDDTPNSNRKSPTPQSRNSNNSKTQAENSDLKSTSPLREKIILENSKLNLKSQPVNALSYIDEDEEEESRIYTTRNDDLIGINDLIVTEEVKVESFTIRNLEIPNYSQAASSLEATANESILKNTNDPEAEVRTTHTKNQKKKLKSGQCGICFKVMVSKRNLWHHMKRVHGPKNFVCNVCDVGFPLLCKLNLHLATKMHKSKAHEIRLSRKPVPVKDQRVAVQLQEDIDSDPDNSASLVQTAFIENNGEYSCTMCNRSFHRKCQLKNHMVIHEKKGKKLKSIYMEEEEYMPEDNSNIAVNITTNEVEQSKVDSNEDDRWQCRVCHKIFLTWKKLRKHKRKHGTHKYSCPICNKPFVERYVLKRHVLSHQRTGKPKQIGAKVNRKTGPKPFECDVCQGRFREKNQLYYHNRVMHGPKIFECHLCDHKYAMRSHLVQHVQRHYHIRGEKTQQLKQTQQIEKSTNSDENKVDTNMKLEEGIEF